MAPRLRPLLTPPNDGTQKGNKLDLRLALKKGAGHSPLKKNNIPALEGSKSSKFRSFKATKARLLPRFTASFICS